MAIKFFHNSPASKMQMDSWRRDSADFSALVCRGKTRGVPICWCPILLRSWTAPVMSNRGRPGNVASFLWWMILGTIGLGVCQLFLKANWSDYGMCCFQTGGGKIGCMFWGGRRKWIREKKTGIFKIFLRFSRFLKKIYDKKKNWGIFFLRFRAGGWGCFPLKLSLHI